MNEPPPHHRSHEPIGHQSNTLVMGPGGYRFGDYWKVGLPLTGVVIVTAVPLRLLVWPL